VSNGERVCPLDASYYYCYRRGFGYYVCTTHRVPIGVGVARLRVTLSLFPLQQVLDSKRVLSVPPRAKRMDRSPLTRGWLAMRNFERSSLRCLLSAVASYTGLPNSAMSLNKIRTSNGVVELGKPLYEVAVAVAVRIAVKGEIDGEMLSRAER
jgi:hypothetical protein